MEKRYYLVAALVMFMALSVMGTAFADENEVVALKNQLAELNQKLASLEHQVRTMEGHITAAPGAKAEMAGQVIPPGEEVPGGLIHTLQDIHMGGYLDVEYNQNLTANTSNLASAAAATAAAPGGTPDRKSGV